MCHSVCRARRPTLQVRPCLRRAMWSCCVGDHPARASVGSTTFRALSLPWPRCALAALHYNESAGRDQAVTKPGEPRWQVNEPRAKTGDSCPHQGGTHLRLIIIAAAPGQALPRFPEPKTSYSARSFSVDGQEVCTGGPPLQ
ncbi:uncharacterized protein LOC144145672 isoform X2 [Haemaphysalis longicornis]